MREKTIEQKLALAVKALGGIPLKLMAANLDGMPDRLILLRPGHRPVLAWKVRYFAQAIFRDRITAYTAP